MRLPFLVFAQLCCLSLTAQTLKISYQDDANNPQSVTIDSATKSITVTGVKSLKQFIVDVSQLPNNATLQINDPKGDPMIISGQSPNLTAKSNRELVNTTIKIFIRTDQGSKPFSTLKIFGQLPPSTLDVTPGTTELFKFDEAPCTDCDFAGTQMVYDFATNTVSYTKPKKGSHYGITGGRPVVGRPFSFKVININPFRDSVVISNDVADYNTDVPDLFTKAFLQAPQAQGLDEAAAQERDEIIAGLFSLGQQVDKMTKDLRDTKVCTNICDVITKVKTNAETFFSKGYHFDPAKQSLTAFLTEKLTGAPPVYVDSIAAVIKKYRAFVNAKNYYYYNIPKVQNTDAYIFTLSVLPKAGLTSNVVVDHQPITVHTMGGWKVDFSTGLFITGLRDERYNLTPADSSVIFYSGYAGDSIVYNRQNQIVRQTEKNPVDFGVDALMHFYPRISPAFNIGLSLGAGLSIGPNPSVRYLGGGSLLLGKNGRFILTYGCAAGFINVLNDGYKNLQLTSLTDPTQLTKKAFRTCSFLSISFSLPISKSSSTTQAGASTPSPASPTAAAAATPASQGAGTQGAATPAAGKGAKGSN